MTIDDDAVPEGRESDAPAPKRGPWRRRLAVLGLGLALLGVLGAGAVFGWLLRGWVPSGGVGATVEVNRPVQIEAPARAGTLPNVLGLGVDEARQAYTDAGVEPSAIQTRETPYFGQRGSVVQQRPAAAAKVPARGGTVVLLVAGAATMPELTGVDGEEARRRLAKIGVGATTVVRYDASVEPGEVASTEPAAGEPATARATLVVSEAPSSVDLADVDPFSTDCSVADADLDGSPVTGALVCEVFDDPLATVYAINEKVSSFKGTVGLADGAPAGATARVVVRAGNRIVGTAEVTGSSEQLEVDLPATERLRIEVEATGGGDDGVDVVVADASITGARSGIDEITGDGTP